MYAVRVQSRKVLTNYGHGLGWIYIMMTTCDYGRVKIGLSVNNPIKRLSNLKTADPFLVMHAAYFIPTNVAGFSLRDIEKKLHESFKDFRIFFFDDEDEVNVPSEWFFINAYGSDEIIDKAFNSIGFRVFQCGPRDDNPSSAVYKHYAEDLVYDLEEVNWVLGDSYFNR